MRESIKIYHGATSLVQNPEIRPASRPMDFGVGFYLTTFPTQAVEWSRKKAKKESGTPVVSMYNLDLGRITKELTTKSFEGTSDEWIDFILKHRKVSVYNVISASTNGRLSRRLSVRKSFHHNFDMVMGEVADDDVFDAITLYEANVISFNELKHRLSAKQKNDQLCFCTSAALTHLEFIGPYEVV